MNLKATSAAVALFLLATLSVGPAALAADSVEVPVVGDQPAAAAEIAPPVTTSDAPATAPEAAEKEEEAHAAASSSGSVLDLNLMGEEAVTLSESSSSAGQSQSGESSAGSAASHATLLSVMGQELWGADANSEEGVDEREGLLLDVTDQICAGSNGQLCVSLLYEERSSGKDGNSEKKSIASVCAGGDQQAASHDCNGPVSLTVGYAGASAHEDEDGTESSSDTSLVDACVGSSEHSASDTCDGPVGGRVAESHSDSASETDSPDEGDQSAESSAENSGAEVCVGGEGAKTGVCDGLGAVILHSESHSFANTQGEAESEGLAHTAAVEAQGEETFSLSQEGELSVPPDCPTQSVICLFLNGVRSEAEAGKAGGGATAIAVELGNGILGEGSVLDGTVDDSNSNVELPDRVKGVRINAPDAPAPRGAIRPDFTSAPAPRAAQLPFTGSGVAAFLLLGLVAIIGGVALTRRFGVTVEH
jgi:hypothetical protein